MVVAGGWQAAPCICRSAADSLRCLDSGAPRSSSLNPPLLVACALLDAQAGAQSDLPWRPA